MERGKTTDGVYEKLYIPYVRFGILYRKLLEINGFKNHCFDNIFILKQEISDKCSILVCPIYTNELD